MVHGIRAGLAVILIATLLTAGCSSFANEPAADNGTVQAPSPSSASWKVILRQPDGMADYVKMDTDVYNIGEVVGFTVTNDGTAALSCAGSPPSFSVKFQTPHGTWATKMGKDEPDDSASSSLAPGASTQEYRFVTGGWEPGRYRIVHDCGVEREILLRAVPSPVATPAATVAAPAPSAAATASPSASPAACPIGNATVTKPWIWIDNISSPAAYAPFTIHGTTTLPAGQDLIYTIFTVDSSDADTSLVEQAKFHTSIREGSCGVNTWSASGEIQATGTFAIAIEGENQTPSAIRQFTVIAP